MTILRIIGAITWAVLTAVLTAFAAWCILEILIKWLGFPPDSSSIAVAITFPLMLVASGIIAWRDYR